MKDLIRNILTGCDGCNEIHVFNKFPLVTLFGIITRNNMCGCRCHDPPSDDY